MTTIIGVDFSGARADTNTWMTSGHLTGDGSLDLESSRRIRRGDLYDALLAIPTPAVVALDFPFGVPAEFAASLAIRTPPADMLAVWNAITDIAINDFVAARNDFVARHGETKRAGDARYHPESYSPLHAVNPNMLPMTYHGINLLRRWHQDSPSRWHVPPLPPPGTCGDVVTLLELMPGALLRALGLPYKGYKRGRRYAQRRVEILDKLSSASGAALLRLGSVREDCLSNDDCLDSVVAAVGAAMWAKGSSRFRHPLPDELPAAKLEGWIYVPKPN